LGFGDWGLVIGVWDSRFEVWGVGFRVKAAGLWVARGAAYSSDSTTHLWCSPAHTVCMRRRQAETTSPDHRAGKASLLDR